MILYLFFSLVLNMFLPNMTKAQYDALPQSEKTNIIIEEIYQ